MMAAFRAFYKSPAAAVLMALLIFSFGIWGVRDVFHTRISDAVITAGSRQLSSSEFKRLFDRQLRDVQQQSGQVVTAQDAVQAGLDRQMLEQLADIESIQELLKRSGVQTSDQLVVAQLRKIPQFFNPVTGQFDQKQYEALLAQNEVAPVEYEKSLKDQIALDHFSAGMAAGLRAPRVYSALFAILDLQSRSADFLLLDQKSVPAPPDPTDAQLTAFMKQNEQALRRPELRNISLVRFSAGALAADQKVDPAMVQKLFDARKSSLSIPERRSFVQIPAKDAGQAAQISARLTRGEDPTAVAKTYGEKPSSYPNAAKTTVPDPKVAEAVFSLQPGQASGPIQGAFGYSVVKLAGVTPGKPATIEDVRPQLEDELKAQLAQEQAEDLANKYGDAHAAGSTMQQAAAKLGVKVYSLGPLAGNGRNFPSGQPEQSLTQKMLQEAFTLPQGGETDVTTLGKGEYYALRVEKVTPSSMPGLDEIRPQLTQVWKNQQMLKALQDKAAGLSDRIKKGETVAAVAASAGANVQHVDGMTMAAAQQQPQQPLGQEFLAKLFQAKLGDVFAAGIPQQGLAVAKVSEIKSGPPAEIAGLTQQLRPQLTQGMNVREFGDTVQVASRDFVKPKVDEKLARQAIGVAAEEGAPASSSAPAKAK
jgi:peptidyl-prolyl cis-trans isomerase D